MLAYTVYSEAGGVGKTTLAANLAVADADAGRDVLVIDMDPQEGSLSYLFDVDGDRGRDDADSLVRHLIENPKGPFEDLVETAEGVDIVPAHNQLEQLGRHLSRKQQQAEDFGERWNPNKQLLRVLKDAGVHESYDTLIVDPPATADQKLYNAIHATRSLVIPFEPSGKGEQSIDGLEELVDGLEEQLDIEVGVMAVVPNRYAGTNDQDELLASLGDRPYPAPVTLRRRSSLFEGCWREQCSAYRYVEHHRERQRDHETETIEKLDELSAHLRQLAEQEVTA